MVCLVWGLCPFTDHPLAPFSVCAVELPLHVHVNCNKKNMVFIPLGSCVLQYVCFYNFFDCGLLDITYISLDKMTND